MEQQGWTRVEEPSGWTRVEEAPKTPAAPDTIPQQVTRGVLRSLPQVQTWPERAGEVLQHPVESLRDVVSGLARNASGQEWAKPDYQRPPVGGEGTGWERAGDVLGTLGQLAVGEAIPRVVRGRLAKAAPEMVRGVSVEDLRKAGVGEQSIEMMRQQDAAPMRGTLKRIEPAPSHAAEPPMMPSHAPTAEPPPNVTAAPPASASAPTLKASPKAFTNFLKEDWHSGAEAGSQEARQAEALHRYEGETASRYAHMLQNQNGSISPLLLQRMGMSPVRYGAAAWAAKEVGLPGWSGMAGLGAYDAVTNHPVVSAEALRAAIAARLAAAKNSATPTAPQGK